MNLKLVPRTMIDGYLRAIRVQVDGAVRLLLAGHRPTRGKVDLAIDRTHATVRALSGVVLRDEMLSNPQTTTAYTRTTACSDSTRRPRPKQ